MSISNIKNNILLFNIFFFSFGGYYTALILVTNLFSNSYSRYVTIPIRGLILISILGLVYNNRFKMKIKKDSFFFLLFSIVYISKILLSFIDIDDLYMSSEMFLIYFLSFVFLPFLLVKNLSLDSKDYTRVFNYIVIGSVAVSILTFFFYGDLIGKVNRISSSFENKEDYLSPLALSYTSVLGISLSFSKLLSQELSSRHRMLLYSTILVCLTPFFLGASRGSVLAFLLVVIFYLLFSSGIRKRITLLTSIILFSLLLVVFSNYFGTAVFERVLGISSGIENNTSGSMRLVIWKYALAEFIQNPVMGASLELPQFNHHPHNIIVEVLMSTGILGFIPFIIFIYFIFIKAIRITLNQPNMFWIVAIFLIGFSMNMFSGAIWGASWFAIGAALISNFKLDEIKNE